MPTKTTTKKSGKVREIKYGDISFALLVKTLQRAIASKTFKRYQDTRLFFGVAVINEARQHARVWQTYETNVKIEINGTGVEFKDRSAIYSFLEHPETRRLLGVLNAAGRVYGVQGIEI